MSDPIPAPLAPVCLFGYNRPEHTRRTLEALSANSEAAHTKLYIYCDGPKPGALDADLEKIKAVQELASERNWCGNTTVIAAEANRGLAESIISGVTEVVSRHGQVIVLEDDLVVSPGFLQYMNEALDMYRDEKQVFQISGFNVRNRAFAPRTGFLRVSTSWGWATWSRAWKKYDNDAVSLLRRVEKKGSMAFELNGCSFHLDELKRNVTGDLDTWAVKWYASIYLSDGLCLYPGKTLVRNIGFDGSGIHCEDDGTNYHRGLSLAQKIPVRKQPLREQPAYLRAMQTHFRKTLKKWTHTRFRDRLRRKASSLFSTRSAD